MFELEDTKIGKTGKLRAKKNKKYNTSIHQHNYQPVRNHIFFPSEARFSRQCAHN